MRRATAVRRLKVIAERCHQVCQLWTPGEGLVAVHAFGAVLDADGDDGSVEVVQVALVVNEPPETVPWCVRPPGYTGLPYVLELEKAPVDWYFRSSSWPVGNHRIDRPLRIWSRDGGAEEAALAALARGEADALREPRPRPAVLRRQLGEELATATAHLRDVRDRYWQRTWRSDHHGAGIYPENHLWDAVHGYLDLVEGVDDVDPDGSDRDRPDPVELP